MLLVMITCSPDDPTRSTSKYLPFSSSINDFAGTETCKSCHEKEYNLWKGSHHDLAMQEANSSTVLADFNQTTFTHNGITSTFFTKDGNYYVNAQGRDGEWHDYKVIYTFGITPLQQYIVEFPNGSYQCLQTAWDTEKNKWFDLQPDIQITPDEWLHWTGNAMKWNTSCADCHSTNLHKNLNTKTDAYQTTFTEINVGCEACHGPASQHVNYYHKELKTKPPGLYLGKDIPAKELVDKCARCHSRRQQITEYFDYEGSFLDHYDPNLINTPTYELDGQILDEDYVYSSFIQSKMYHEGVSCRDCHDMHSMQLKQTGNALCNTCHEPQKYDVESHHFHEVDTDGATCVNCHMTGRTYMGNDFRRDHSFRIPRPDQSIVYGTPNACNGCHEDQSSEWAADFIIDKYGPDRADHFSDHLMAGYNGDPAALAKVMNGAQYPDIARATALQYYGNQLSPEQIASVRMFLADTSALVRNQAIRIYDNTATQEATEEILPLLGDELRLVRLSAARFFNMRGLQVENSDDFQQATKEYNAYIAFNHDTPSAQHELAQVYQARGEISKAITTYRKALEIDNHYNYARMNLALLLYQQGNKKEAEALYKLVIGQEPNISYPYYMLGLYYNENNELGKSMEYLKKACEKEPPLFRAHYNYLLLLQKAEKNELCISVADEFLEKFPRNDQILYLSLLAAIKSNKNKLGMDIAEKLVSWAPNNQQYIQIYNDLKYSQ